MLLLYQKRVGRRVGVGNRAPLLKLQDPAQLFGPGLRLNCGFPPALSPTRSFSCPYLPNVLEAGVFSEVLSWPPLPDGLVPQVPQTELVSDEGHGLLNSHAFLTTKPLVLAHEGSRVYVTAKHL